MSDAAENTIPVSVTLDDEWYPVSSFECRGATPHQHTQTVYVTEETASRWERARDEFEAASGEIAEIYGKQAPTDRETTNERHYQQLRNREHQAR